MQTFGWTDKVLECTGWGSLDKEAKEFKWHLYFLLWLQFMAQESGPSTWKLAVCFQSLIQPGLSFFKCRSVAGPLVCVCRWRLPWANCPPSSLSCGLSQAGSWCVSVRRGSGSLEVEAGLWNGYIMSAHPQEDWALYGLPWHQLQDSPWVPWTCGSVNLFLAGYRGLCSAQWPVSAWDFISVPSSGSYFSSEGSKFNFSVWSLVLESMLFPCVRVRSVTSHTVRF